MLNPKVNNSSTLVYIRSLISSFNKLKDLCRLKNKTKKILACIDTVDILLQRLKATEATLVSGANDSGLNAGGIEIQRAIYENILEYWADIVAE